jgi:hypothetical protein
MTSGVIKADGRGLQRRRVGLAVVDGSIDIQASGTKRARRHAPPGEQHVTGNELGGALATVDPQKPAPQPVLGDYLNREDCPIMW